MGRDESSRVEVGWGGLRWVEMASAKAASRAAPQAFGLDPRLLAALRVLYARSCDELGSLRTLPPAQQAAALQADGVASLSAGVEEAALRTGLGVVAIALGQFPTSLEQDEGALRLAAGAAGSLGGDGRLAAEFRAGKKRLLRAAAARIRERLDTIGPASSAAAATT